MNDWKEGKMYRTKINYKLQNLNQITKTDPYQTR